MRVSTYSMTVMGALSLSLTLLARQAPAPPPAPAPSSGPPAPFYAHIVASGLRGGYQVLATDMNKDGKVDLIGLPSAAMAELVWYENPYWTPHVITRDALRMINVAAADTDRDGIPELGLAYEFANQTPNAGKIAILKANGDPRAPWTLREIDSAPRSHRVRFATIGGQTMLVNAPLLSDKARDGFNDPDHTAPRLKVYRSPDWKPELISETNQGAQHGLTVEDWNGDGRPDVLTASYLGVHAHNLDKNGTWTRTELAKGDPSDWPRSGASDIAVGRMNGKRFFVTNEPFHGNQVVVYTETAGGLWPRNVIETQLNNSHSLVLVDSDGDGNHEIVSGGTRGATGSPRGFKPGVFFYKAADASGQKWERMVLDAAIASNNCVTADINGDKKMDVVCIDDNLKWYENTRK